MRLEDELKKLLARGSHSESDLKIEVEEEGETKLIKAPEPKGLKPLSLRSLQNLLKRGEVLLSSYAMENQTNRRAARLRSLLDVGEALLRSRCALERRGLRSK